MKVTTWIKHDRLDDEVMVVDLDCGAYFAFTGAAADAWTLLAAGHDPAAAGACLASRYEVAPPQAAAVLVTFAGQLVAEKLLEPGEPDPPTVTVELEPFSVRLPWVPPAIERFDDRADLLMVDPIHEVEPRGWPAGRDA